MSLQLMSSRSKRKTRNLLLRDRTVTTLESAANTPYLVPTATVEPALPIQHIHNNHGAILNDDNDNYPLTPLSTSVQFSPTPGPLFPISFSPYALPPFSPEQPMQHVNGHPQLSYPQSFVQQQQQQISQQHPLPAPPVAAEPGQRDLEILQSLKERIKSGQHEYFQPIPQPQALEAIFLGRREPPISAPVAQTTTDSVSEHPIKPSENVPQVVHAPSVSIVDRAGIKTEADDKVRVGLSVPSHTMNSMILSFLSYQLT
jgi:hypothetical protein